MYIFEITYPGTSINLENKEVESEIQQMLMSFEGILTEAAISLSMFESSHSKPTLDKKKLTKDAELRTKINRKIRQEAGQDYFENFEKYQIKSKRRFRQAKIKSGDLPRSYLHKIPFIHAHTFVYAIDSFGKFIEEIANYESIPQEVSDCVTEFNEKLPSVRKIRNSALHLEDRTRGFGPPWEKKKGKKMETNGFLGLSNLENNFLCYTIDDGSYQKVEISVKIFNIIVDLAERIINSFDWQGHPRIVPNY